LTNSHNSPGRMQKKGLLLLLAVLLTLSCGGPGKNTRVTGIYYQVKPGDTLMQISRTYNVSPRKLAEVNKISQPEQLLAGSVLFIPDAEQVLEREPTEIAMAPKGEKAGEKEPLLPSPGKVTAEKKGAGPVPRPAEKKPPATSAPLPKKEKEADSPSVPPPALRKTPISQPLWQSSASAPGGNVPQAEPGLSKGTQAAPREEDVASALPKETASIEKGLFSWPVKGKVANRFGQQPNGMYYNHIRIVAKENTPVTTAAQGTVIFSAPLKEFGETVIIKHDTRFATVYTHLGSRLVKVDQRIRKGDQIGLTGKSEIKGEGYIHFEIRDHNKSRNPLLFLP